MGVGVPDINTPTVIGAGTDVINTAGDIYNSERNLQFQKDLLEYQKEVQQTTWNREDTAVQRRVTDLEAAGLSPVLAAGSAASTSAPMSMKAPQREKVNLKMSNTLAAMSMMKDKADISLTAAQKDLIAYQKAKYQEDIKGVELSNAQKEWDLMYYIRNNLPTNTSGIAKSLAALSDQIADIFKEAPDRLPAVTDWFQKLKEKRANDRQAKYDREIERRKELNQRRKNKNNSNVAPYKDPYGNNNNK